MSEAINTQDADGNLSLFRPEAVQGRRPSLEGEVVILNSKWLAVATLVIFFALVVATGLLVSASVPRIQEAAGWVTTTKGLVQVQPFRAGVVDEVRVREGQFVRAGDVLATVRVEQMQLDIGGTPERALLQSLDEQDKRLLDEIDLAFRQASDDEQRLNRTIGTIKAQLAAIAQEEAQASAIVALAEKNVSVANKLMKQGAYSRREVWADETDHSQKTLSLDSLHERHAALNSQLVASESELQRLPIDRDTKIAELQSQRAALGEKLAETEGQRSYALTAPVAGRIASVVARPGYPADGRRPLITIIPSGAQLSVELFVPSSAIGFVKSGEQVRLMYDAFPYQRFGSHMGRVTSVSRSALLPNDVVAPIEIREAVYLVSVTLDQDKVDAFGSMAPLQAGMTLSADIVLEKRSVFEWLFEPIFAMRGRG